MKNLLKLFVSLAVMIAAFACSSSSDTPSGVVTAINKAMQNGDYETVVSYIYLDETRSNGMDISEFRSNLASMLEEKGGAELEKKGGIESFEIIDEQINEDGTKAQVTVKTVYGNGTEDEDDTEVVKHDGKWYIELNK